MSQDQSSHQSVTSVEEVALVIGLAWGISPECVEANPDCRRAAEAILKFYKVEYRNP